MRISQRLDYALKALVLLAAQDDGTYVAAGDLAERLLLPRRFVEQQITALSRAGIVTCRRGAAGGCALNRPAHEITAKQAVEAIEGCVVDVPRQQDLAVTALWEGMAEAAESHLASVSVADLLAAQRDIDANAAPIYYI